MRAITSPVDKGKDDEGKEAEPEKVRGRGVSVAYLIGNFAPCVVAHPYADWAVHLIGGGGRRLVALSIRAHLYVFVDDLYECTCKIAHRLRCLYNPVM